MEIKWHSELGVRQARGPFPFRIGNSERREGGRGASFFILVCPWYDMTVSVWLESPHLFITFSHVIHPSPSLNKYSINCMNINPGMHYANTSTPRPTVYPSIFKTFYFFTCTSITHRITQHFFCVIHIMLSKANWFD